MVVSTASEILKNALPPSQYEQIEALIPECPGPGDIGMDRMEINEPIPERPKPGILADGAKWAHAIESSYHPSHGGRSPNKTYQG